MSKEENLKIIKTKLNEEQIIRILVALDCYKSSLQLKINQPYKETMPFPAAAEHLHKYYLKDQIKEIELLTDYILSHESN